MADARRIGLCSRRPYALVAPARQWFEGSPAIRDGGIAGRC